MSKCISCCIRSLQTKQQQQQQQQELIYTIRRPNQQNQIFITDTYIGRYHSHSHSQSHNHRIIEQIPIESTQVCFISTFHVIFIGTKLHKISVCVCVCAFKCVCVCVCKSTRAHMKETKRINFILYLIVHLASIPKSFSLFINFFSFSCLIRRINLLFLFLLLYFSLCFIWSFCFRSSLFFFVAWPPRFAIRREAKSCRLFVFCYAHIR